ncbi:LacI family transcriptional regulator [Catenulispora sp. EB89]|uniref:LacI family DNA-binding transcriptional regulator n=1 Tax=Catenulispora sp. EB89 TaxID=3156257 RepID=UPI0035155DDE
MAVTINDVARAVGVSTSTVSRAFTLPDQVRAETRERILEVSAELGYVPNPSARSLRAGATATLGMIIPDIANPFFPPIFKALQQRARQLGYTTLVADCDDRESAELDAIAAIANRVDGLLLWASALPDERLRTIAAQTPLVLVNRDVEGISSLRINLTDGVRQAGELLFALGHRHCALIDASRPERQRDKLFAEAFRGLGLTVTELGPYEPRFETGVHAATLIASSGATAVLAHNDLVALGALQQFTALGVRVPTDVSLVGIDDTLLASVCTPALTSVRIDAGELAAAALELLVEAVGGGRGGATEEHRRAVVGSRLVPRASTGPAPVGR